MSVIIEAKELSKIYGSRSNPVHALGPVNLTIEQGDFVVIIGRSGSGKSTFLNLMAGLDKPSSGELIVQGKDISKLNSGQLAKYRASVGIVFQFYNLLPNLNTVENVLIGGWAGGMSTKMEEAKSLLEKFSMGNRLQANVKTLSGGEKQRVAIARSLVGNPQILFCDEPTGALDTVNEDQVKNILVELNKQGMTIVMVTHNPDFTSLASKVVEMKDGYII
ncbi:MAG: ABC transporter ATP-binding protein [Patescibacteria group bacterium]